jgi:hypothetical protein
MDPRWKLLWPGVGGRGRLKGAVGLNGELPGRYVEALDPLEVILAWSAGVAGPTRVSVTNVCAEGTQSNIYYIKSSL